MLSSVLGQEVVEQDAAVLHPHKHDLLDGGRWKRQGIQKLRNEIDRVDQKFPKYKFDKKSSAQKRLYFMLSNFSCAPTL